MKKINIILLVVLYASIFGCKPAITFNEPQPKGSDNLSAFGKRLQGEYLSLADSSTLIISGKLIQRNYYIEDTIHQNQLNSSSMISGDTITDSLSGEQTLIQHIGDSLVLHLKYMDTLFQFNNDYILRKFKGFYFLNNRLNDGTWDVIKMQLSKGQLLISSISTELDLENLSEITETSQDTIPPFNFTPTRRQFKKFVKNGGFGNGETFIRLK